MTTHAFKTHTHILLRAAVPSWNGYKGKRTLLGGVMTQIQRGGAMHSEGRDKRLWGVGLCRSRYTHPHSHKLSHMAGDTHFKRPQNIVLNTLYLAHRLSGAKFHVKFTSGVCDTFRDKWHKSDKEDK